MEALQRKINFIGKIVFWFVIFVVNSALCLPGIIISLQYRNDICVTKTGYFNVFLDWWLLIGSLYQFFIVFMTLPYVCFNLKNKAFRVFMWISNALLTSWIGLGIFLVIKSDLRKCQHDSLWLMSMIYIIIVGIVIFIQVFYTIVKKFSNRVRSEEPSYHELWSGQRQDISLFEEEI